MVRIIIAFILFIGLELYVFRTFHNQFSGFQGTARSIIYIAYWLIPVILISSIIYLIATNTTGHFRPNKWVSLLVAFIVLFYLPKLFIVVFQLIEDFGKIAAWGIKKISHPESAFFSGAEKISRSVFVGRIGLIIALIPFISILYGVIYGRYNFKIKEVTLEFEQLPAAFDGLKIVQFSDFHAGSLSGEQEIFKKAFGLINSQNPDIIVFTGDMVNSTANELDEWLEIMSTLKAKYGKFSILGNHDYGDYTNWESESAKEANLELLKSYHKQMGFELLLNKAVKLELNGDSIALLGVENWGEKPFPQHGQLEPALAQSKNIPFKILLSHDPSHWEHEVKGKTDIALTLSGHTHGMQMAVNIAGFSWSPVSLKYPRWNGLYSENAQYLYVNIGLGYIGFPGRVGTNPEITSFTLRKKN